MSPETVDLAILFADVSGSTLIYDTLGDRAAKKIVGKCISTLAKVTEEHQGTVVKTVGDELMCTFPNASLAVAAAKEMQQTLERLPKDDWPVSPPPSIHAGIHLGPVIPEGGDVFGDAVNVAARMVSLAKPRQILVTEETLQALTPQLQDTVRLIDRTKVKGKREVLNVYEVIWEWEDLTYMFQTSLPPSPAKSSLKLYFRNQVIQVDADQFSVTLGRHSRNDLVVDHRLVSRTHARIEYRRGKFLLVDQSTNGTFVRPQEKEGEIIHIHRDEVVLQGSGFICLGPMVGEDCEQAIHFTCEP